MREILFRGKDRTGIMNHSWQVGALDNTNAEFPKIIRLDRWGKQMIIDAAPETVGQFTGITDKNGKKIFEGDILSFSDRLVYVHWHDYRGCWDCSYIRAVNGKATLYGDRGPNKWRYNAEVVGNIHDNPELLKG